MIEWKLEKPNKTGYWMWKIPVLIHGNYKFSVSYFDLEEGTVFDGNEHWEEYELWWNENRPLLTYFVGK